MKSAFLLASPRFRARLRRERVRARLREIVANQPIEPADQGYLRLAEVLLAGSDSRPLPDDEKVDFLSA